MVNINDVLHRAYRVVVATGLVLIASGIPISGQSARGPPQYRPIAARTPLTPFSEGSLSEQVKDYLDKDGRIKQKPSETKYEVLPISPFVYLLEIYKLNDKTLKVYYPISSLDPAKEGEPRQTDADNLKNLVPSVYILVNKESKGTIWVEPKEGKKWINGDEEIGGIITERPEQPPNHPQILPEPERQINPESLNEIKA